MKKLITLLLALLLTISAAGCAAPVDPADPGGEVLDTKVLNPLTGLNDMQPDRVGKRPYAICVNNVAFSWPHYGVSQADVVFEVEIEGGITRMLCLYSDIRGIEQIGSVRSFRMSIAEFCMPLDAILVHWGMGEVTSDEMLEQAGYDTLDADLYPEAAFLDKTRNESYSIEGSMFVSGERVESAVAELPELSRSGTFSGTLFRFAPPDAPVELAGGSAAAVSFPFSPLFLNEQGEIEYQNLMSYYDGDFRYDDASGAYLKWQRGEPQRDAGVGDARLAFENVIVLLAEVERGDAYNAVIDFDFTEGGGQGYYFSGGRYGNILWTKGSATEPLELFDAATGQPLAVNAGKSYLCLLDSTLEDTIKIS